jgi:opacity protein-like surface antigen
MAWDGSVFRGGYKLNSLINLEIVGTKSFVSNESFDIFKNYKTSFGEMKSIEKNKVIIVDTSDKNGYGKYDFEHPHKYIFDGSRDNRKVKDNSRKGEDDVSNFYVHQLKDNFEKHRDNFWKGQDHWMLPLHNLFEIDSMSKEMYNCIVDSIKSYYSIDIDKFKSTILNDNKNICDYYEKVYRTNYTINADSLYIVQARALATIYNLEYTTDLFMSTYVGVGVARVNLTIKNPIEKKLSNVAEFKALKDYSLSDLTIEKLNNLALLRKNVFAELEKKENFNINHHSSDALAFSGVLGVVLQLSEETSVAVEYSFSYYGKHIIPDQLVQLDQKPAPSITLWQNAFIVKILRDL